MLEMVKEIVRLAGADGAAVVAFGVLMALVMYQTIVSAKRAKLREEKEQERSDKMLERILHGDGNGGASLGQVQASLSSAVGLAKSADEKADQALTEVRAVRGEVKDLRVNGCSNRPAHLSAVAAEARP